MTYQLIDEIIELSESKHWETAKLEWEFEKIYLSDTPQTCLCGHFPIVNICVIRNRKNHYQTEVGNCCINKFLDIDNGNKILISIKRLKTDDSKSMSPEALFYLYDKNVISQNEYDIYSDIQRKRNLSVKQLDLKKRINKKLINFTSYEASSALFKINLVLKWAETRPDFNTAFVLSLKDCCEKGRILTVNQMLALDKIITAYKIN